LKEDNFDAFLEPTLTSEGFKDQIGETIGVRNYKNSLLYFLSF